jgi:glycosyltransferase involved in cell wall biosynthesis
VDRVSRRVLCVVHSPLYGGPHNEVLRLDEAMRRRGWETVIAVPDEPGTAVPRLRAAGIELEELPLGRLRADPRLFPRFVTSFRPTVRALDEAIARTGASVVQIGGLVNPHAAVAARRRGAAVVWQIVDAGSPALLRWAAMRLVRRHADAIMFDGEALIAAHGGRESLATPTFVYFPPVDTDRFAPSPERRASLRSELGIPADAPVVGTVSHLTPLKALESFLSAATQIAAARPDARFVVVGSAPESHAAYGERLRRQAAELDLPQPILFAGPRDDVERWYAAMDVHLITSRSEGTTTTALEAQACGVPVVSTDVGAVHEVVAAGVTGLLVPPGAPDAIAAATLGLLDDAARRAEMGRAGRAAAVERFGIETAADLRARVYESALEHANSRRSADERISVP